MGCVDLSSSGLGTCFSRALLLEAASRVGASPDGNNGGGHLGDYRPLSVSGDIISSDELSPYRHKGGPTWLDLSGNGLLAAAGQTGTATAAAVAHGAISGCRGVSLAWNGGLGPETALMATAMAQVRPVEFR